VVPANVDFDLPRNATSACIMSPSRSGGWDAKDGAGRRMVAAL